ncbi:hypothetical protein AX774_g7899 [Zancudomyces culisetae]|uniref:Uncharacterized protein n=1 Tax=Zancudomyces culisetae TaxID=1213189 RepID=A0A1R1PCK0_ZANCU|nr:hypothetical protein AX774_g7899 [Zancudomyces culisetae]|eukprot:OMH78698.1 hypothetical protein AX774_g7899 [Zancudomyces culisetae]
MILYLRLKYVDKVWALDTKIYEGSPAPFRKRTSVSPTFSKTISSKPEQVGEYVLVRGSSQSHNLPEIKRESGIVKKQNVLYSDVFSFKEPRSDRLDSYVYNESRNNLVHFSEHSVLIADDKPTSRFIFNKTRRFLPKPEIPAVIEYKTTKRW